MTVREAFELHAELRFERENPAAEAILLVIEDELGRRSVQRRDDPDNGETLARLTVEPQPMSPRRAKWLCEQLQTLAKYLHASTEVQCSDAIDGDRSFRLEARWPAPEPEAAAGNAGNAVD